jgi:ribosomal protein L24
MRNHLITMSHNSDFVIGNVPGVSNLRDLHVKQQGGSILQHAAPVIYSNLFLLDKNLNFVKSVELAQKEYTKFKNKFLELSITTDLIDTTDIPASVDALLAQVNRVKNSKFPWYYSDMVPYGSLKQTAEYTILNPQIRRYEIATIFNDTVLSNRAVLVYYHVTQKSL